MATLVHDAITKMLMALIFVSLKEIWIIYKLLMISLQIASRSRVMLETASVAGGAVAAFLLLCIIGFIVYVKKNSLRKQCEIEIESQKPNHTNCDECQKF